MNRPTTETEPTGTTNETHRRSSRLDAAEQVIRETFADRPGAMRVVHVWNDRDGRWFRVNWYASRPGFGQYVTDSELVYVNHELRIEIRTRGQAGCITD